VRLACVKRSTREDGEFWEAEEEDGGGTEGGFEGWTWVFGGESLGEEMGARTVA